MTLPITELPALGAWNTIAAHNGLLVTTSNDGGLITSNNGVDWTEGSADNLSFVPDYVWHVGALFFAFDSGTTLYATSTDGITWTEQTGMQSPLSAIGYSTITAVSMAHNGTSYCALIGQAKVLVSADGINWSVVSTATLASAKIYSNGAKFIILYVSNYAVKCLTSADGTTWTYQAEITAVGDSLFESLLYVGSTYYLFGYNRNTSVPWVIQSTDLISWGNFSTPFATYGAFRVAHNGEVFCGVHYWLNAEVETYAYTSIDGSTWVAQLLPIKLGHKDIAWNGKIFCAVSNRSAASTVSSGSCITSPDGTFTEYSLVALPFWTNSRGQREVL